MSGLRPQSTPKSEAGRKWGHRCNRPTWGCGHLHLGCPPRPRTARVGIPGQPRRQRSVSLLGWERMRSARRAPESRQRSPHTHQRSTRLLSSFLLLPELVWPWQAQEGIPPSSSVLHPTLRLGPLPCHRPATTTLPPGRARSTFSKPQDTWINPPEAWARRAAGGLDNLQAGGLGSAVPSRSPFVRYVWQ